MIWKPGLFTSHLGPMTPGHTLSSWRAEWEEGREGFRVSLQPHRVMTALFPKEVREELRKEVQAPSQETTDTNRKIINMSGG